MCTVYLWTPEPRASGRAPSYPGEPMHQTRCLDAVPVGCWMKTRGLLVEGLRKVAARFRQIINLLHMNDWLIDYRLTDNILRSII